MGAIKSNEFATIMGKQHTHVLRDIRRVMQGRIDQIAVTDYIAPSGKRQIAFLLTEKDQSEMRAVYAGYDHISRGSITAEKLRALLNYDPDTGIFTYKVTRRGRIAGDRAGSESRHGYIRIIFGGKSWPAHQLAWLHFYGELPKLVLDHINRRRDDNRIKNLREVTRSVNSQNRTLSPKSISGVTGVTWRASRGKWKALITVRGQRINLGSFNERTDAVNARRSAEEQYFDLPKEVP